MLSQLDALLGRRLRCRRLQLKMTQKDLGRRLGVTPQLVHKWERAQSALFAEQIYLLAKVLDVEPAYFFEALEATAPLRAL